jgi:hypothetical protein
MLYDLAIAPGAGVRRPRDFAPGPVPTARAFIAGHLDPHSLDIVQPDPEAVSQCLPHNWRKAFTRANAWWFPSIPGDPEAELKSPATRQLYDRRGRFLATLSATPYFPELRS